MAKRRKKLITIRKPKVRITPKGIKLTRPSARIGGKVGVNVSSRGVSASAHTPVGTISTGRAEAKRKKRSGYHRAPGGNLSAENQVT